LIRLFAAVPRTALGATTANDIAAAPAPEMKPRRVIPLSPKPLVCDMMSLH